MENTKHYETYIKLFKEAYKLGMKIKKHYETYIKLFNEAYKLGVTELFNEVYKLGYNQGCDDGLERFIDVISK